MKISINQLEELMNRHIFLLSEEEVIALAFILDITITHFKKSEWEISFKMTHNKSSVNVNCSRGTNCSIGRKKSSKISVKGMVSWGGIFSFSDITSVFRNFYCNGYEITIQSAEKLKVYNTNECQEIVLAANNLVK